MNSIKYKCDRCTYETDTVKSIKKHIDETHGQFNCFQCGEQLNIRKLYRHEVYHLKDDIINGKINSGEWDTYCCFCGVKRDKNGFHYCQKNFIYSYSKETISKPRGKKVKVSIIQKYKSPFTKLYKKQYNNILIDGKPSMLTISRTQENDNLGKLDKKLSKKNMQKIMKMKKYSFKPKLSAKYDSDNISDTDTDDY